jgi:hypothetical protein
MSIKQDHAYSPRKADAIDSGNDSSKLSAIFSCLANAPGFLGSFVALSGANLAIGLPALAMIISWPVATDSSKRDR